MARSPPLRMIRQKWANSSERNKFVDVPTILLKLALNAIESYSEHRITMKITMQNFPFLQNRLLSASQFISHCENRGVRTNKKELEKLHKLGLLFPCAKFHSKDGYKTLVMNSYLIPNKHSNEIYKSYFDNDLVTIPINKSFIPWNKYEKDGFLMYDKLQIYPLLYILTWRKVKISFNHPQTKNGYEAIKKYIANTIHRFDEMYIREERKDFMENFEIITKIDEAYNLISYEVSKHMEEVAKGEPQLNKRNTEFDIKEYNKEVQEKYNWLFEEGIAILKEKVNFDKLEEFKHSLLHLVMPTHEDVHAFKLIEKKRLSAGQMKGKRQLYKDTVHLTNYIDNFFQLAKYKGWVPFEVRNFNRSEEFETCDECGRYFHIDDPRRKFCSKECSRERENRINREKKKAQRKSSKKVSKQNMSG